MTPICRARFACMQKSKSIQWLVICLIVIGVWCTLPLNAQQTERRYLSGVDKDHTVIWEFYCTQGYKSGSWSTIEVPSCWEQQGFGNYNFGRDFWNFGTKFKYAEEQGYYRYSFQVPSSWKGKKVRIVFEGSMTDTEVIINGKTAGPTHQGGFYKFSYDITDKLVFGGSNLLEANVKKMSDNESVNKAERYADYWIFGGIYRPVYLEASPVQQLEGVSIDAKADGSFVMQVYTAGLQSETDVVAVVKDGTRVLGKFTAKADAKTSVVSIKDKIASPKTWTAETPNLYRVEVSLVQGGKTLHTMQEVFGFRTIEIRRGDGIYLNGVKIKMKGINRHCFWPETGRTLSREVGLMDLQLIKGMNMNAVRCSHYPPDQDFLYLCDSLGLYVIDELAGWQDAYDTEVGRKLVREMVERDRNHPSIIFWSNGNEGGHNRELEPDYAKYDFSARPLIRAHHRPGNDLNGIDCNHYEGYNSTQRLLQDSLIFMTTEFIHCQDDGGGAAGLEDFWELMWSAPRSGGGFLWALLDEGLVRTDQNNMIDNVMVNANDGVLGPHREKEGSYNAIKEIFSPVVRSFKVLPKDFSGTLGLENRYHYTNLNECTFNWQLVDFKKPKDLTTGYDVKNSRSQTGPNVLPGEKGEITLYIPTGWKDCDALMVTVLDPHGDEVVTWTFPIRTHSDLANDFVKRIGTETIQVSERDSVLTLQANGISVSFSESTGKLLSTRNASTENALRFGNGPVMVAGKAKLKQFTHHAGEDNTYVIDVQYEGDLKTVQWKMYPTGWLEMNYSYALEGQYSFTGISFDYPEQHIVGIKYLGEGPCRVWKNRPQGVQFNVWSKLYNNTQTGSFPWFYPEFKGYHANVAWMEVTAVEGKFLMAISDPNVYVRLFEFYALSGARKHPELPVGDISFLDHIPATGTKMAISINANPSTLGPMSQQNVVSGTFTHRLFFYFGCPE